ncbi:hypothetical protein MUK60_07465 [Streptomyces sp. LRE541]|uniref:hypothetical protein n=1 Tax=Streptomyces sp. LRE541 TaxID=2931983 RepID=UPI00200DF978|nr:hypothetical protein [Streptomyces sp. LRE541]UPZ27671.1 hypothetical protein MUK60_07465 [Streptomyces sp. LRE541]
MNQTIRRIAISGSAAVALLGGAAAIGTATAPTASAADIDTAINRATGAPVKQPDGRITYVRGMDAASYRATPEQHTVILAAAKNEDDPVGEIGSGLTPDNGSGAALGNPNQPNINGQTPANGYNPQQIQTQAGGGTIAVGVVAILALGIVAYFRVKGPVKAGDAVLFVFLGVALSGTVIGVMAKTMTENGVGSLGGVLGGL